MIRPGGWSAVVACPVPVAALDGIPIPSVLANWWPPSPAAGLLLGSAVVLSGVLIGCLCFRRLPAALLTLLFRALVRVFYRMEVRGRDHVPSGEGAMLVCNHITWADAVLLGAACPRDVRFVAAAEIFRWPWVRWVLQAFGVIPISQSRAKEAVKAIGSALQEGEVVCIYAEGKLSRTGGFNAIQRGYQLAARRVHAPVVPVCLDGLWGSVWSYAGGCYYWKRPRHIPYRYSVMFGAPIPAAEAAPGVVLSAIRELSRRAIAHRPQIDRGLLEQMEVDSVRGHGAVWHGCGSTSSARHLLRHGTRCGAAWRKVFSGERVGVALPPGRDAALAVIGLYASGRIPLFLPPGDETEWDSLASGRELDVIVAGEPSGRPGIRFHRIEDLSLMEGHDLKENGDGPRGSEPAVAFVVETGGGWKIGVMSAAELQANVLQIASTDLGAGEILTARCGSLHRALPRLLTLYCPLLHGGGRSLRCEDPWDPAGEDAVVSRPRPGESPVISGWTGLAPEGFPCWSRESAGVLVTFSVPDPGYENDPRFQPGKVRGSAGKLLPGYAVEETSAGALVRGPVSGDDPILIAGRFDEESFLFLNDGRKEVEA